MADVISGSRLLAGAGARTEASLARGNLAVGSDEGLPTNLTRPGLPPKPDTIGSHDIDLGIGDAPTAVGVAGVTTRGQVPQRIVGWVAVKVVNGECPRSGNGGSAVPINQPLAPMTGVGAGTDSVIEGYSVLGDQPTGGCQRMVWKSDHPTGCDRLLPGSCHDSSITYSGGVPFQT